MMTFIEKITSYQTEVMTAREQDKNNTRKENEREKKNGLKMCRKQSMRN